MMTLVYVRDNQVVMTGDTAARRCWCCDPKTATPTETWYCGHTPARFSGGLLCVGDWVDECTPSGICDDAVTDPRADAFFVTDAVADYGFTAPGCELNMFHDWEMDIFARMIGTIYSFTWWRQVNFQLEARRAAFDGIHRLTAVAIGSCADIESTQQSTSVSYLEFEPVAEEQCISFRLNWFHATKTFTFTDLVIYGSFPGSTLTFEPELSTVMQDSEVWPCCNFSDLKTSTAITQVGGGLNPSGDDAGFLPVVMCYRPA